jgi:hypothetical protein
MTNQMSRQSLGCGYEPPLPAGSVRLALWQPPDAYRGATPTVCAGYTTKLPEVHEAQMARAHWNTGNLGVALGGELPTEDLLSFIVILEGASNEVQRWCMKPVTDGGGR